MSLQDTDTQQLLLWAGAAFLFYWFFIRNDSTESYVPHGHHHHHHHPQHPQHHQTHEQHFIANVTPPPPNEIPQYAPAFLA